MKKFKSQKCENGQNAKIIKLSKLKNIKSYKLAGKQSKSPNWLFNSGNSVLGLSFVPRLLSAMTCSSMCHPAGQLTTIGFRGQAPDLYSVFSAMISKSEFFHSYQHSADKTSVLN